MKWICRQVNAYGGPGLMINFHEIKLAEGVVRMILPGANREASGV